MPPFALTEGADPAAEFALAAGRAAPPAAPDLASILAEIEALAPPLWPLKDYVAVNPFLGLSGRQFLSARQLLRRTRDCELLPSRDYFRDRRRAGAIGRADIESALRQCRAEYPGLFADWSAERVAGWLEGAESASTAPERRCFTIAEVVDRRRQSAWSSHIVNDITRHCSAHYDDGQAAWPNPWKESPLYQAWREAARLSWRMDYLGIQGFQRLVGQLPATPTAAIAWLLRELDVPASHWRGLLLCELGSVAGWASFVKYRVRQAEIAGQRDEDLLGLLAMRLAYDVALARAQALSGPAGRADLAAEAVSLDLDGDSPLDPPVDALARYVLQVAAETSHRRKLLGQLAARPRGPRSSGRKEAQLIFCIDVRSELMRRHLESLSATLETFGFAGFFGMAFEYVPLGESSGAAQCPVLLNPGFRVGESVVGAADAALESAIAARREQRLGRRIWKSFQTSAVSCFSFVESIGPLYFAKLLADSLRLTRPVASAERDGLPRRGASALGPDPHGHAQHALPPAKKADLAESMLRNLGLTENFARIVVICGHAAEVVNNPYKAGLDCGACGGHSGEPNARVAAALLNDPAVRAELAGRGVRVPDDTWFLPALHVTTTDEIRLFDAEQLPATHAEEFARLKQWLGEAGRLCRAERGRRLNGAAAQDVSRRGRDWSETRPEWGLAGNAAFVVAPRARTAGLDLGGRAFLHSYDHTRDPDLNVLELIMTAPMIVTSWINLQYFASTVDNRSFGSGNKVIHNVVGQFGVLLGNGGDLMTGLPWQSVHDGADFQHEPLRLLVVIEAPRDAVRRIIDKHALVRELVGNGWLSLAALEGEQCHRWTSAGDWEAEPLVLPEAIAADNAARGV